MGFDLHTVEISDGSNAPAKSDRLQVALLTVTTAAGAGAGDAVTQNITGLSLPANYNVQATPSQDAVAFISAKTNTGFTLTTNPRLAANTLAAGTVDLLITF